VNMEPNEKAAMIAALRKVADDLQAGKERVVGFSRYTPSYWVPRRAPQPHIYVAVMDGKHNIEASFEGVIDVSLTSAA
jgi:hypothetical protein